MSRRAASPATADRGARLGLTSSRDRARTHRDDPEAWARELGISSEAVELYLASDVIDLHVDSFIWHRLLGRDITHRHGKGLFGARFFGQADLPRLREAEIGGATWVITTNPLRDGHDRVETVLRNVNALLETFARVPERGARRAHRRRLRAARRAGKHAAFVGIQGGNAFDEDPDALDRSPSVLLLRVTLVHLTSSHLGGTSSPLGADDGHRPPRRRLRRTARRPAHLRRPRARRPALVLGRRRASTTASLPLLVTHTGVSGVHRHWRNLDDDQLRAVAKTGGVVGIMYHAPFLGDRPLGGRVETIVRHLEHVRNVAGDDTPALGSDWDGAIVTPRDMPTCLELPRLVECMLARDWPSEAVKKALGRKFLARAARPARLKRLFHSSLGACRCALRRASALALPNPITRRAPRRRVRHPRRCRRATRRDRARRARHRRRHGRPGP